MLHQFCGGVAPKAVSLGTQQGTAQLITACEEALDRLDFSVALSYVWAFMSEADKLIVQVRPWELAKSGFDADKAKLSETLSQIVHLLRVVGPLIHPALPGGSAVLWKRLGQLGSLEDEGVDDSLKFRLVTEGTKVGKPEPIFPRLDKEKTLAKLREVAEADRAREQAVAQGPGSDPAAFQSSKAAEGPQRRNADVALRPAIEQTKGTTVEQKSEQNPTLRASTSVPADQKISIDDFGKVEMRVGQVIAAERIPNATKLLKLQVDIGTEIRQVCAGIAEYYAPEKLVGMKVVVVTNLAPRKLRGVESNGMIVAASVGEEGRPVLPTFAEDVPNGAKLK